MGFSKVAIGAGLALTLVCVPAATSQVLEDLDFKVEKPAANKVKVTFSAQASGGVSIGSYVVNIREVLPSKPLDELQLPGMKFNSGRVYLVGQDFPDNDVLLKDNGKSDEDSRPGVFATTLDTSSWPAGHYTLIVAATNRPSEGDYHHITRAFTIDVGDEWQGGGSEISNIPGARHVRIYKKNGIYAAFPALTRLDDGRFGTDFDTRVRASHIDPTGGNQKMVSSDGGETWTPFSGQVIRSVDRAADGSIVTSQAEGWIYVPESERDRLVKEGAVTLDAMEGQIAYLGGATYSVSKDEGRTWETHRIEIPGDVAGLYNHHYDASLVRTGSGVRLNALYGQRKPVDGKPRKDEVFFLRSPDDGKTWTVVPMLPNGLSENQVGFNETTIAELPDGSILAVMRTTDEQELYTSVSHDSGLTWSAPLKTEMWGFPAHLVVLPDGRLLCVYGRRKAPYGIRASLSSDNGKTWDVKNELIVRSDGLVSEPGDIGYPLALLRDDGKIFTIYYIPTDGGMPAIEGTIFEVPPAK